MRRSKRNSRKRKRMNSYKSLQDAKRIVIKIGSVLITNEDRSAVNKPWFDALTKTIKSLIGLNKEFIIVSSGGVALGRASIGIALDTPPCDIPLEQKQASSAVGQFYMFQAYHEAMAAQGITAAQVLLTMGETENRRMHLNAREAMNTLMERGIIPVINENDVISTGEIRFGDNDRLAARVAQMMDADALILLSTIDGLYDENPDKNPNAAHISLVEDITDAHTDMAGDPVPGLSTGGMKSKIEAAQTAVAAGIDVIIADGRDNEGLERLFGDENARSTLFTAVQNKSSARKRWIGAHVSPKGEIHIDDGALAALHDGKSLLPVGVKSVDGDFERGDAVSIISTKTGKLGVGLAAYSAADARLIAGKQSREIHDILGYIGREELIHRDDMVLQG